MMRYLIFVVEPDEETAKLIVKELALREFEAMVFANAEDVLEALEKRFPALILTEWDLPTKSGYDLLVELRQKRRTSHLPIMLMSHRNSREDKIKVLEAGADDFVTKPLNIEELGLRVSNATVMADGGRINSISGFPMGNLIKEHLIELKRSQRRDWVYIYIILWYLFEFREIFGWDECDKLGKVLSEHIKTVLEEFGTQDDFAGHPGGGNFVLISHREDYQKILDELETRFREISPQYYSEEDIERGFMLISDRKIPLLRLNYGIFNARERTYKEVQEISDLATQDLRRRLEALRVDDDDGSDILTSW